MEDNLNQRIDLSKERKISSEIWEEEKMVINVCPDCLNKDSQF
jgi:hypothetical protein